MSTPRTFPRFPSFPELRTQRLLLREFKPGDAPDVLVFRGDPEVQRYNSEPLKSQAEALAFIEEQRAEYAAHQGIPWAVTDAQSGQVLGCFNFGPWDEWHRSSDLGYDLRRDRWGQGLAAEALGRIIAFGFDTMGMHRIQARTRADNQASIRLLERLGFKREGTRRQAILEADEAFYDSAIYGLLSHEFPR